MLSTKTTIHPSREAQIASLGAEEVTVPTEYSGFAEVFLKDSPAKLPKHTGINNHAINLDNGKQLPYEPIYSLGLLDLETLKTYIKINLASNFIRLFKSPAGAPILFV